MRKVQVILAYLYLLSVSLYRVPIPQPFGSCPRVIFFLMLPIWLIYTLHSRRVRNYPLAFWFMTLYVLWSCFSWFWSFDPDNSANAAYHYITFLLPYFLVYDSLRTKDQILKGMAFFCFGSIFVALDVIGNFITNNHIYGMGDRFTGLSNDVNFVGAVLVMHACIAIYLIGFTPKMLGKWNYVFTFFPVPLLIAAIMTGSRTVGLVWLIPLIYGLIILKSKSKISNKLISVIVLVLAVGITVKMQEPLKNQLDRIFSLTSSYTVDKFSGRVQLWMTGFEKFKEHPVLGVGSGAFSTAIDEGNTVYGYSGLPAHNTFLSVLTETGLVGFFIFMTMFFTLIMGFRPVEKPAKVLWLLLFLCWLAGSLGGTLEGSEWTWAFLTLAILATRHLVEEPVAHEEPVELPSNKALASSNA